MANSNAIKAGDAYVQFTLSDKGISGQLAGLQSKFRSMGAGLRNVGAMGLAVGGSITGAFAAAAKIFADTGSELYDMSKRTGLSVESLSELSHAADVSGTSLEDIEKATKNMQKNGLDPKKFDQYANAIAGIKDPTLRAQKAMEVFGKKTGTALLPMLDELPQLRKEARELGLVMSAADAKSADALGDAMQTLWEQAKMVVVQIGAAVAGPLTAFLDLTKPILAGIIKWVKNNRSLVATVAAAGLGIAALGAILVATGIGFSLIAAAMGGFAAAGAAISTVIGAVMSPMVAIGAILVGGVYLWAKYTESGQAAVAGITGFVGELWATFTETFGGIKDALSAGDLALAGRIGMLGLKIVFLEGLNAISKLIGGSVGDWVGTFGSQIAGGNFKGAWDTVVLGMSKLWNKFLEGMTSSFGGAAKWIIDKWREMATFIANQILKLATKYPKLGEILKGNDRGRGPGRQDPYVLRQSDQMKSQLETLKKFQSAAQSGGKEGLKAVMEKEGWDTSQVENWDEWIKRIDTNVDELETSIAKLKGSTDDPLGDMQKNAADQLQGTSDALTKWIDDVPALASDTGDAFSKAITGGADKGTDALQSAQDELDKLRKQAADEAAKHVAAKAGDGKTNADGLLEKESSRGTFNATNLLALQSATGGPEQETARNTKAAARSLANIEKQGVWTF